MQNKLIRNGVFLTLVVFLAAACASAQPATPAATAVPSQAISAPPTSAPAQTVQPAVPSTGSTASSDPTSAPQADGSTRYVLVPEKSEARYRVREQLANVSLPSDAVGKTRQISGAIVLKPDGTVDSSQSKFVVDLSTLQSDRGMRDNFLRRNVLQTSQYPNAVFVPTGVSGLPADLPHPARCLSR